MNIMHALNSWM